MAGTVATDFGFFSGTSGGGSQSDCEATTDWSGSPTLDTEVFVESAGALSAKVSKSTYTSVFTLTASVDMSDQLLVVWMNCSTPGSLDSLANGGMRIRVEDASVNWAEWAVAGNDTYAGGWVPFIVRTNQSTNRTESATAPSYNAITKVGVVCKTTGTASKINFWWDAMRYGTYLQVYAGTSGSPATWDDFLTSEASNFYGLVQEEDGVIFVQTPIRIGSTSAGQDTYFSDSSKAIVFRDNAFGTGFYEILGQGNATGDTRIFFGSSSGGAGISGGTIRSAGASKYSFDFSDSDIDYLGLYGVSFYDADPSSLPATSANREVLNCSFEACGEVTVSTCKVEECNFISSDTGTTPDGAVLVSSTSHNLSKCNFIACPVGVHIDTPGTYNMTNLVFTGCTADIGNDSGALVTINALGTSDPSTETNIRYSGARLEAQQYDYNAGAPTYTNEATAARNTTTNDMNLLADADEQEDTYYFGQTTYEFFALNVDIGTQGSGTWTVTWEYYNGSTWTALSGVTDGTSGFTATTGWKSVTWTQPGDWATVAVNGVTAYWVRARISSWTSVTTVPLGDQAGLIGDVDINLTVSVSVTAQEGDGTKIQSARVLLEADTGGDLPAGDSVSITRSGTTATVSHSSHGMLVGEKVTIRGADQPEYNGVKVITAVLVNSYDYTVSGAPDTPATGTITATAVILDGDTSAGGVVSRTDFNYTSSQPVTGVVRKGTASPYFKATPLTGTIGTGGLSTTAVMAPDE